VNDDRADRHFILLPSLPRLPQGLAHKVGIAVKIDDFVHEALIPVVDRGLKEA
jgi:hypothetical protein